jgi:1,6-anhydro-N-acetylmuramate kinase
MPLSTECRTASGKTITVADALKLNRVDRRDLVCIGCGQRVSPHKESKPGTHQQAAHFEHIPSDGGRNRECPLSDTSRR